MQTNSSSVPPHFLVVVPGFMGSKLRDKTTGEIVWIDPLTVARILLHGNDGLEHLLKRLAYPNKDLEPAGILDEVLFFPHIFKSDKFDRLWTALEQMGYRAGTARYAERELNVYAFAYDWRQDNRISARELKAAIERWSSFHPGAQPWIIAHSNGGVVARWYIENEGGKERVGRLFLMASPWDGTPKAIYMLHDGFELLGRRFSESLHVPERSREILLTFPSLYQLIPHQNPFLRRQSQEPLDVFTDAGWLSGAGQRELLAGGRPQVVPAAMQQTRALLLADGRRFNAELSRDTSVETVCFFGRSKPTVTDGVVSLTDSGEWKTIEWLATEAGDGTVPERSAIHPHAQQKIPFACGHDVYAYPPALEVLRWELLDKYSGAAPERAALTTARLTILFEPDRDVYSPGDQIRLWASVNDNPPGAAAVSGAQIQAELVWRQPLPGAEPRVGPAAGRSIMLAESESVPGRYEGVLNAPAAEGYYDLRATVEIIGEAVLELRELVAVDAGLDV